MLRQILEKILDTMPLAGTLHALVAARTNGAAIVVMHCCQICLPNTNRQPSSKLVSESPGQPDTQLPIDPAHPANKAKLTEPAGQPDGQAGRANPARSRRLPDKLKEQGLTVEVIANSEGDQKIYFENAQKQFGGGLLRRAHAM